MVHTHTHRESTEILHNSLEEEQGFMSQTTSGIWIMCFCLVLWRWWKWTATQPPATDTEVRSPSWSGRLTQAAGCQPCSWVSKHSGSSAAAALVLYLGFSCQGNSVAAAWFGSWPASKCLFTGDWRNVMQCLILLTSQPPPSPLLQHADKLWSAGTAFNCSIVSLKCNQSTFLPF